MNKVELIGRLTKDPDKRTTGGENAVAVTRYTLAVDRRFNRKDEQSADFINIVAFGNAADFAATYLKKGMKIAVIGHIQTASYINKEGIKVYTTDIVAEEQEFVETKSASRSFEPTNGYMPLDSDNDRFMDVSVDPCDLPFK